MAIIYPLVASTWGREEHNAILNVLASGQITMGPHVRAFEGAFARYHGRRHAVMTNSGSSANLLAVGALMYKERRPLRPGDTVIVPALSWATTYAPLQQYGLRLLIVDIDIDTLNIDARQLPREPPEDVRAIVGVSILGNLAQLDTLRDYAARHKLYFIEDSCESLGAKLNGWSAGNFGDISTFSFFFSHQLSTGEGGMLLTDDDELFDLAEVLRAHGWDRHGASKSEYRFILPGYNVRPLEFAGAVGLEQLKKLSAMLSWRWANWTKFRSTFGGDKRFIIQLTTGHNSAFSFTMILKPELAVRRERVVQVLADAGIETRMITGGCFTLHKAAQHYHYDTIGDLPNAKMAHERGFFVGNHPFDLTEEINHLRDTLERVLR